MSLPSEFSLRVARGDETLLRAIGALRLRVWGGDFGYVDPAAERAGGLFDVHDPGALHVAVLSGDGVVASTRLTLHAALDDVVDRVVAFRDIPSDVPAPLGVISRTVADACHRGRGLARALVERVADEALREGVATLLVASIPEGVRMFTGLGFEGRAPVQVTSPRLLVHPMFKVLAPRRGAA